MAVALSAGVGDTTVDVDEKPAAATDAPVGVKGAALIAATRVEPAAAGAGAETAATTAAGANDGMNGAADGEGTNGTKEAAVARSVGLGAAESDMVDYAKTDMRGGRLVCVWQISAFSRGETAEFRGKRQ